MTFLSFLLASFQSHFLWTFLPPRTAASRCLRHSLFHWRHTTVQRAMSATWAARWQETPDPMLPGTETMSASTPTLTTTSPTHVGSAPWWYSKSGPRTAGITPSWQRTIWAEWSVQLSLLSKVKKKTHQNYLLQLKSTLLAACLYCSLLSLLFQIRKIQLARTPEDEWNVVEDVPIWSMHSSVLFLVDHRSDVESKTKGWKENVLKCQ